MHLHVDSPRLEHTGPRIARRPRPHGRPWSGAFNVVMATAIVSIACHDAGLLVVSQVLMWLAIVAFAPLALLDAERAAHPLALLHRAGEPEQGFAAFGFVADTCVLGARLMEQSAGARVIAAVLLACGAIVWAVIVVALAHGRPDHRLLAARGEWLLAVVATEGLAIGAGRLAAFGWGGALHVTGVVLWALGGVLYVLIGAALVQRLARRPLHEGQLTPDWWIVMGAAAIFTLAATSVGEGSIGWVGWAAASAWIPALVAGEIWQARRTGPPHFTPARWTMVFPLGMYSAASQHLGMAAGDRWLTTLGRWWLVVALAAWLAVAAGEGHHAFLRAEG